MVLFPPVELANAQAAQEDPMPCPGQSSGSNVNCEAASKVTGANELQGKICQASIQNQIDWDYKGNNRWASSNLERICKNAKYSLQPGVCFQRVMHGNLSYGSGTRWRWQPALRLCAGTQDSNATIACFTRAISQQIKWPQAIEQCRVKP